MSLRRSVWLALGLLGVLLLIAGSLHPAPPQPVSAPGSDKLGHFLAYGGLLLWFGQLGRRYRWPAAIGLFVLGVTLEGLQGLIDQRHASFADVLANTAGIATALLALRLGADHFGRSVLQSASPNIS